MKTARSSGKKIVLCIVVIVFILFIAAVISIVHHRNTYFTKEKWNEYSWNDRQLLVKSLLRQYDLRQMTKDEITDLLGYDSSYSSDFFVPFKTHDNLVYDFGLRKNTAASNIALIDGKDHVTAYELKTYSQ